MREATGRDKIRRSDDKATLTVVVVSVALLIPLVTAIALFTDAFAKAFSGPAMVEGLLAGACVAVGFGIVNLLTLSRRWRKPVAGAMILACGLLFGSLLWLVWTFFNSPSTPEWMIRASEDFKSFTESAPQFQVDYGSRIVSGLILGVFIAALNRFFQKPWQEEPKRREVQTALLAIGTGLTIVLLVYIFSGN